MIESVRLLLEQPRGGPRGARTPGGRARPPRAACWRGSRPRPGPSSVAAAPGPGGGPARGGTDPATSTSAACRRCERPWSGSGQARRPGPGRPGGRRLRARPPRAAAARAAPRPRPRAAGARPPPPPGARPGRRAHACAGRRPAAARRRRGRPALKFYGTPGTERGDAAHLIGHGVLPGRATGTARVVRRAADLARVEPATCSSAPPPPRRGCRVPLAGRTAHGHGDPCDAAVIAREYDLPAVVGTETATARITDGVRVTLDGATGDVWIG